MDFGIRKPYKRTRGELFLNATDLLNSMTIKEEIQSNGFDYSGADYYETQVFRVGYNYKF